MKLASVIYDLGSSSLKRLFDLSLIGVRSFVVFDAGMRSISGTLCGGLAAVVTPGCLPRSVRTSLQPGFLVVVAAAAGRSA